MSLTFDNDGFCKRMVFAAPLDPLLGNTGLLGGVYGLLYATGNPENPLKVRTHHEIIITSYDNSLMSASTILGRLAHSIYFLTGPRKLH